MRVSDLDGTSLVTPEGLIKYGSRVWQALVAWWRVARTLLIEGEQVVKLITIVPDEFRPLLQCTLWRSLRFAY
jgi:hypothetical protein